MYKIYADDTLIYDSTLEDYKIGKGQVSREVNKAGSFVFSIYPDHFYYDRFVRLKTVIKVTKSNKIIFRGRVINDVTDYWNNKTLTCEGELAFLQDSIVRPFDFSGTPEGLFIKFITEHNKSVDEFKRFKVGLITVTDMTGDGNIERSNSAYETTLSNMNSRLLDAATTGGYFYITHGDDGTEEIPTIHYVTTYLKNATQTVEFGVNLKDYTKTVKAEDIATAIIPLGAETTNGKKLTIKVNDSDLDYVYSQTGVSLYGWIFKVVEWEDVKVVGTLKARAEAYVNDIINASMTLELTAIDLHLIDRSIESFNVCEFVHVISKPHNIDVLLLCSKQTIDLLKPDNDSITLGRTYPSYSEYNSKHFSNALNRLNGFVSESQVTEMIQEAINNSGGSGGDDSGGDDSGGGDNTGGTGGDNTGGDNTGGTGGDTGGSEGEGGGDIGDDPLKDDIDPNTNDSMSEPTTSESGEESTTHYLDCGYLYAMNDGSGYRNVSDGAVKASIREDSYSPIQISSDLPILKISIQFNTDCVCSVSPGTPEGSGDIFIVRYSSSDNITRVNITLNDTASAIRIVVETARSTDSEPV